MKLKKTIILLSFMALLFGINTKTAKAAPQAEAHANLITAEEAKEKGTAEDFSSPPASSPFSLSTTAMKLSKKNNQLSVGWTVTSACVASEIGSRSLKLQRYTNGSWKTVKTGSYFAKNKMIFASGYCYKNAAQGSKYRATGTAYTIVDGKTKTRTIQTSTFTY